MLEARAGALDDAERIRRRSSRYASTTLAPVSHARARALESHHPRSRAHAGARSPARCRQICPPTFGLSSTTVTRAPDSAARVAAAIPAGPRADDGDVALEHVVAHAHVASSLAVRTTIPSTTTPDTHADAAMPSIVTRHSWQMPMPHSGPRTSFPSAATKAPFPRVQQRRGDGDAARRSTRRAVQLE